MSTSTTDEVARRKTLRRRHLLQRQTIVFGTVGLVVVAIGLAGLGVFTGLVPKPFSDDFTDLRAQEEAQRFTPCPNSGALPVAYPEITTNVYNGTDRSGLASDTGTQLASVGVNLGAQANYAGGTYTGTVEIITGTQGVPAAYTLANLFDGAVITYDATRSDQVLDLVLGEKYEAMKDPATSALDPATPLVGAEGCQFPSADTEAA